MISRGAADSLILVLLALGGFICGLAPLLLLYFSLDFINHLFVLLFAVYAVFFAALGFLALGAWWIARKSGVALPLPGLRTALFIEAAGLSAIWYKLLNPFPLGPLLQNQQYLPAATLILVPFLGWLLFIFILKKYL